MSRSGARRPITRPRSVWERHPDSALVEAAEVQVWSRRVHDGALRALVGDEPAGLHLSISHQPHDVRRLPRYPTWDEIADARDQLLPGDLEFVMILPAAGEYVAVHDTTFHLHQHPPAAVTA